MSYWWHVNVKFSPPTINLLYIIVLPTYFKVKDNKESLVKPVCKYAVFEVSTEYSTNFHNQFVGTQHVVFRLRMNTFRNLLIFVFFLNFKEFWISKGNGNSKNYKMTFLFRKRKLFFDRSLFGKIKQLISA